LFESLFPFGRYVMHTNFFGMFVLLSHVEFIIEDAKN
jgi:hypothetical protein